MDVDKENGLEMSVLPSVWIFNSDFMEAKVLNGAYSLQEDGQIRQKASDEIGQPWQSSNPWVHVLIEW